MGDNESEEEYITSDNYFESLGEYYGDRNELSERHGLGNSRYVKGDEYRGQFSHGKRHGKGVYKFKNARYVGSYKDAKRHGTGTMIYPDGSKYVGHWKGGLKHGKGVYDYANGDRFEGGWLDDAKHGVGVYHYKDTGSKFYATWNKGEQNGMAKLVHSDHKYEGMFKDNLPLGRGKFTFDNGIEQYGFYAMKNAFVQEDGMLTFVGKAPAWQARLLTQNLQDS